MRSMTLRALAISTTVLIAACGGSYQGASAPGGGVPPPPTSAPTAATVTLLASAPQLSSNATLTANGVTLTALVKDANNNVIPGVTVAFSTPNSAAIAVTQPTTNSSGAAQAVLTTGGDPTPRIVTVTASSNGVSGSTSVSIVGTTLTVSGPVNTQSSVSTNYTAVLLDSGGAPIANQTIQFSYVVASAATLTPANGQVITNASGQAQIAVSATSNGTLQATALGLTATQAVSVSTDCFAFSSPAANTTINLGVSQALTVNWKTGGCTGAAIADNTTINFSTTRGTLSTLSANTVGGNATVSISATQAGFATITGSSNAGNKPSASLTVEFVATDPASISVQGSPSTIGTNQQSTITAVVLDRSNNLVKNATVQFALTDTTGGTLSAGQAITNSQGKAQVTYAATSTPSSSNGVVIKATVTAVSGNPVTVCPSSAPSGTAANCSGSTSLTVGGAALNITLGTGNKLSAEGPPSGSVRYVMPWSIVVRDSAGNPAPSAQISLSIHAMTYGKGCSEFPGTGPWIRTNCSGGRPISCTNEDLLSGNPQFDLNGILDPGEDLNGDGILQPGGIATVPSAVALDSNGSGNFEIRYPEDEAYWVRVRLRAVANVAGTESVSQVFFDLPGISADFASASIAPPGVVSPHGFLQDCAHEQILFFTKAAQGAASGTTATANISLSSPAGLNPITIPFTVTGSSVAGGTLAVQGTDFTITSPSGCATSNCSLTIPANGSTSRIDVSVTPTGAGGTAVLALGTPSSQAILGSPSVHTVALGGAAVSFSVSGETTSQNAGPTAITVKLDRALPVTGTGANNIVIPFSASGSRLAADYTLNPAASVTIAEGSTSASITVTPTTPEAADSTVVLTLGTPTSGPGVLNSPSSNTLTLLK